MGNKEVDLHFRDGVQPISLAFKLRQADCLRVLVNEGKADTSCIRDKQTMWSMLEANGNTHNTLQNTFYKNQGAVSSFSKPKLTSKSSSYSPSGTQGFPSLTSSNTFGHASMVGSSLGQMANLDYAMNMVSDYGASTAGPKEYAKQRKTKKSKKRKKTDSDPYFADHEYSADEHRTDIENHMLKPLALSPTAVNNAKARGHYNDPWFIKSKQQQQQHKQLQHQEETEWQRYPPRGLVLSPRDTSSVDDLDIDNRHDIRVRKPAPSHGKLAKRKARTMENLTSNSLLTISDPKDHSYVETMYPLGGKAKSLSMGKLAPLPPIGVGMPEHGAGRKGGLLPSLQPGKGGKFSLVASPADTSSSYELL